MPSKRNRQLTGRERQIMDIVYRHGHVTVSLVLDELPDPPSYSAVRALMRILEQKGHVRHEQDGPRYVFSPTVPRGRAQRSALSRVVHTFFDGSTEDAVAALLDMSHTRLSDDDFDRLSRLINDARKEGR